MNNEAKSGKSKRFGKTDYFTFAKINKYNYVKPYVSFSLCDISYYAYSLYCIATIIYLSQMHNIHHCILYLSLYVKLILSE